MLRFSFACVLLISATPSLSALDVYVSATGDDSNKGSSASPVASLERARQIVQPVAGKQPVTVHVGDGVYYLPDSLRLGPEDSGTQESPVVYQAQNRGKTVLSGGKKLELQWRPYRDGVFQTSTPAGLSIDQLFVDGQLQRMARYPNYDPQKKIQAYQGHAADAFSKSRAAGWKDPTGGFIHAMHRSRWGGYHYRITGKDSKGNVTYEGGWQNNRPSGMHDQQRMVENIFEELDAPGEWFHDSQKNTLYFQPSADTDLANATIEVVRLRHLVELIGTKQAPVRNVTFSGFVYRHAARTFMETKEQMLRSDWTIYRGGAVFLKGTEDITITDSEMDQLGGNAVFVSDYNRRVMIQRCHIHDTGASGVCFVGNPNAVRDPLFRYGEKNDLRQVDRTPGPKNNQYPADCVVDDCLIHGIGRVERQPAGVQIEMASQITVRDCSIYDCARAGINIGDGAWGGHLIERCDVFDTVQETHDHGSFNSWGRDRYWSSNRAESQAVIDDEPDFPFLDAYQTTVIRNSRWRCDHGWDIDLDDGSSNYDIYNNLMLSGGLKLREGFRRRAWNNITINNGLHPHVWYNDSGDEVFSNIFMAAPQGARMPTPTAKGKRIEENLYYAKTPGMKDRYADFGWDRNSIVADPLFVNPSQGDFRVKDGSPAFDIGFENFPMDQFGVKDKRLKAIAATPEIPELDVKSQMNRPRSDSGRITIPRHTIWMGVRASDLKGAEFSAFGVSADEGGIALSGFTPQSAAAKEGLKEGDLIQAVNGSKTKRVDDLLAETLKAGDQALQVTLIRDQRAMQIEIRDVPFLTFRSQSTNELAVDAGLKREPKVLANQSVRDEPLSVLVDGRLDSNYGPVFGNGVTSGIYKLDLGQPQVIRSVAVWSHHLQQRRGPQQWTLYASASKKDPGWNVNDTKSFRPLTSVDTRRMNHDAFNEVVYSAEHGADLGVVRWLVWQVSPVTSQSENTSFQEIRVR